MTLPETLDRLESIYDRLQRAALSKAKPDAMEILFLRQQFARAYIDFVKALEADDDLEAHSRAKASLKDALDTMRIRLMSYTMAWQPQQIEADPAGYREAAQGIADMVGGFIAEARGQLQRVASA